MQHVTDELAMFRDAVREFVKPDMVPYHEHITIDSNVVMLSLSCQTILLTGAIDAKN